METKFNSQICTTREQSERLLALGLKKETADCCWVHQINFEDELVWSAKMGTYTQQDAEIAFFDYIPAWSLHRLWELYWSNKVVSDCLFGCGKHMSPYAKMIAMIEYDIEDGTFNKEYLNHEN